LPTFATGTVEEVVGQHPGIQSLRVRLGGEARIAILYTRYTAPAAAGDRVVLNTTATTLGLGSGGEDFVVWNLAHETYGQPGGGHIMKLRYTPLQTDVLAVEAPESPHHDAMRFSDGVGGMPVLAASLHSQLLPVVAAIRTARPSARIAYVMTDGGALDASLSNTVRRMRELGWLQAVITVGHAIGGDLEAVNLYSGLIAARAVAKVDAAVVGMGPGVVGTSTPFGTTALEAGMTLNATASLGGIPIAVVRMSSGDERDRHAGISHHSLTALMRVALAEADVPVPKGHAGGLEEVATLHRVIEVDAEPVLDELERAAGDGLAASHMGRGPRDDRLFFLAAGAAGFHAASFIRGGEDA
jgi:hypothetical protein